MMDLSNLTASKNTVIKLSHPVTGEPLTFDDGERFTWTLLSKHTGAYKKLYIEYRKEIDKKFGKKKISELTPDELEDLEGLTLQLTINSTVDFNIFIDGEKPEFSKKRAKEILMNEDLFWLKNQVSEGANDAANFMPR